MLHTDGSPYKRLRLLSSLGLIGAVTAALSLLAAGHSMHGALMGLAGLSLLPSSHFGRRARRQAALQAAWAHVGAQGGSTQAKPRRAA
jgi:hypothetical protein